MVMLDGGDPEPAAGAGRTEDGNRAERTEETGSPAPDNG